MAQNITIGFNSEISSADLNSNFKTLLGDNVVVLGYTVKAGSLNKISIWKNGDKTNCLFIGGAKITDDSDYIDAFTISPNSSGSKRIDGVAMTYNHGTDIQGSLVYTPNIQSLLDNGSWPSANQCALATIEVPSGFTSSSELTIKNSVKCQSMTNITNKLASASTSVGTTQPSTLIKGTIWIDTN